MASRQPSNFRERILVERQGQDTNGAANGIYAEVGRFWADVDTKPAGSDVDRADADLFEVDAVITTRWQNQVLTGDRVTWQANAADAASADNRVYEILSAEDPAQRRQLRVMEARAVR